MSIQDYLLKDHLKPLFVFRFDNANKSECLGVFVGCKGKLENGDPDFVGLQLDELNIKPKWNNKTPLWIIPLSEEDEKYSLRYNSLENEVALPENIKSCHITIIDQQGKNGWKKYTDLKDYNPLYFLNFEAKYLSILDSNKYQHKISTADKKQSIAVWFFGDNKIKTSNRLIKFSGIECDIVDKDGQKQDFDIWCGIRYDENIFLAINNKKQYAESDGKDCPIVWENRGLKDDTLYTDNTFGILNDNNNLSLKSKSNGGLSDTISNIVGKEDPKPQYDKIYSWFLKEKKELSIFFRNIKQISNSQIFFNNYLSSFSGYKEINLFQTIKYKNLAFEKSIIVWIVGNVDCNKICNNVISSLNTVRLSNPYSISPTINPAVSLLGSFVLEYKYYSIDSIELAGIKLYNGKYKDDGKIIMLDDKIEKITEFKLLNFKHSNYYTEKNTLNINDCDVSLKDLNRSKDSATWFGFNIIKGALKKQKINIGSLSFNTEENITVRGKVYFSLQLQKAQKPLYLWEWYPGLEEYDTIIPCYAIEEFNLPVKDITPLSSDLSEQDRYIADNDTVSLVNTGTLRPELPLIIPMENENERRKYYLSIKENINAGQDFNFSAELTVNDPSEINKKSAFEIISLGGQPQNIFKVSTPFGINPLNDNGKYVVARINNLSADGAIWEIFNEDANELGVTITTPPQIKAEAYRKSDTADIIENEPDELVNNGLVDFKFGPPAVLQIANEQLNRQMVTAPWNLRNLFGSYGDSNPGLRLLNAQFELLYGMSANLENKDAYIAELENKLGQLVRAPKGQITWEHNTEQRNSFNAAYAQYLKILKAYTERLAIYEVSSFDKFKPAKFTEGIDYSFRVDYDENATDGKIKKGAKLIWPFKDKNVPSYLQDIKKKYHDVNGLAGGFHFGFESMAIYNEFWEQGLKYGSSSGEIENLSFTSLGGYGKQVARFANDKSIIKSTTSLGSNHFYAVERIGRIGVFWNKAKHVIEYERTVVPSEQFKGTANMGRAIMRKVREFVEILEPERRYPEFGATPSDSGSILGTHFKSIKIPVSSTWGNDINRKVNTKGDEMPIGWEIPLWNLNADHNIYPFPQILLKVLAPKDAAQTEVLCTIANPENLYFYTDVRQEINGENITANTNRWPSILNVDYTVQEFDNIYIKAEPCLNYDDPTLINAPLPSPLDVLPGFERYSFQIISSDILISANGAYNTDSKISGKLRNVTMQRKPNLQTDKDDKPIYNISSAQQDYVTNFKEFLKENVNGYTNVITSTIKSRKSGLDDNEKKTIIKNLDQEIIDHFSSIANTKKAGLTNINTIIDNVAQKPNYIYLKGLKTKDPLSSKEEDIGIHWEIPTKIIWYQLTKELDAGIGAVDKHYNFLFKGAKEELEQLIAKISDNNLKDILLNRIDAFKSKITDIKSQIDINLNQVDAFTKLDNKKLNAYIDKANSDIKVAISEFIEEKKKVIENVAGAVSLDQFKDKIEKDISDMIEKLIEDILSNVKINETINNKIQEKSGNFTKEKITNKIDVYLTSLDDASYQLKEAKKQIIKILEEAIYEADNLIDDIKNELNIIATNIIDEVNSTTTPIRDLLSQFKLLLDKCYAIIIDTIDNDLRKKIDIDNIKIDEIKKEMNSFFEVDKTNKDKFVKVNIFIEKALVSTIQNFLIDGYKNAGLTAPPLANLFEKADQWIKDIASDFNSFLNKIKDNATIDKLKKEIEEHLPFIKSLYKEYKGIEDAIKSGNKDEIIKHANKLSQTINKDFGNAIGKVTDSYYKSVDVANNYNELDKEIQNTLLNYRSVIEDIKAVDLGFNRKTIELVTNFKTKIAPKLLLTPVIGKLEKLNDSLNSMGISLPYAGLEDKFVAPLKAWGEDFANSLSERFPVSNLLNDIGGIKFDNLLPFLNADDTFFKAVKITQDVDKDGLKAWVKADVDYTFTEHNTFMNIGPVKVRMLKNARVFAHASESIDIDKNRQSENKGELKATLEISLSAAPLMYFRDVVISFKNGKYDFDLDPKRMEMPGLLKLISDASKNLQTISQPLDKNESPFKREIVKIKTTVGGQEMEMPVGFKANLDIPPTSIGGGPTAISNLSFGGHFNLQAIELDEDNNLRFNFLIGLGFYLGKKERPFNFTAFILGGGGYIDCNFKYKPSERKSPVVHFVMSIHASAAFAINAGWINGGIMILAGIEVEYISGSGGRTRIEMFIAIIGNADILGLITIYLQLRLAINYQSDSNGTVLYGIGTVSIEIKICSFVTISVNKSYTMILKGESKSVSNQRSESIAASLN